MKYLAMISFAAACSAHGGHIGDDQPDASPPPPNKCKVQDEGDAPPTCSDRAPPDSFAAELQWTWIGPDGEIGAYVTPLVANLTDDNGDGAIDLCDTPDVVVVASAAQIPLAGAVGHLYVLDGKTGAQELRIATGVDASVTPAIGDLDGDGVPEIVTTDPGGKLWAFHHDGSPLFGPADAWPDQPNRAPSRFSASIALADLDGDGRVEILAGNSVFDDRGHKEWTAPGIEADFSATTAADLDGDGVLEVVLGAAAYRHDGTLLWDSKLEPGYPQIGNFDGDPDPEVLLTNKLGVSLIKRDGRIVFRNQTPTHDIPHDGPVSGGLGTACDPYTCWIRAAAVGDFDGDGIAEFAMSSAHHYSTFRGDGSVMWSTSVSDESGIAAGTAFDFLGDGHTEAMYADEQNLFVFDANGHVLFQIPRTSQTLAEYPVVADIDNDGSAEIVVVSNPYGPPSPTVQVIHDRQDRWIPARRIWNQHTYHVTNVREDGTIPAHETPSWRHLNSFRANAQVGAVGVCVPVLQ